MQNNFFTIDTEDWYHANYKDGLFTNGKMTKSTVEENVNTYLEIFDKYQVKATFFVLGIVAEEHPDMICKIHEAGHEIASHGYAHMLVYNQTPEEFRNDVRRSKQVLESLIHDKVIGYRAPSWSITENSLWALRILEEEGFVYTSSIFPTKNQLYGIPDAPRKIYVSSYYESGCKLIQIPPSTFSIFGERLKVPFSGGAYFRLFPISFIKSFSNYIIKRENMPVVFYLHPREIDKMQPKLKLSFLNYMIHYYGIGGCQKKLEKVLKEYQFDTIRHYLLQSKQENRNE